MQGGIGRGRDRRRDSVRDRKGIDWEIERDLGRIDEGIKLGIEGESIEFAIFMRFFYI
jgi:hypothetical protein